MLRTNSNNEFKSDKYVRLRNKLDKFKNLFAIRNETYYAHLDVLNQIRDPLSNQLIVLIHTSELQ